MQELYGVGGLSTFSCFILKNFNLLLELTIQFEKQKTRYIFNGIGLIFILSLSSNLSKNVRLFRSRYIYTATRIAKTKYELKIEIHMPTCLLIELEKKIYLSLLNYYTFFTLHSKVSFLSHFTFKLPCSNSLHLRP